MNQKKDNTRMILYLNRHMKGKYILLVISIISIFLIAVFNILKVYFMESVVNALEKKQSEDIPQLFVILFVFIGLGMVASYFEVYSIREFAVVVVSRIRKTLFAKVLHVCEETMKFEHSGKVVSLFTNELLQIENFLSDSLHKIVYYPIIFVGGFIYMLTINTKLAIISIIVIPPLLAISKKISNSLEEFSNGSYKALSDANATAQDYIQGVDTVKSFNLEKSILHKYRNQTRTFWNWQKKAHKTTAILLPFIILTYELPIVVCAVYGGILCLNTNQINAGGLIAFLQLLGYIIQPLADFPDMISNYMKTKSAVIRISDLENLVCEEQIKNITDKNKKMEESNNIVEFIDASFCYKDGKKILEHINLEIPYNSVIGLVGSSGGGKTTILSLILGLYMNYEGSIKVLGKELKDWCLDELRENISASLREDYFFADTIYNNSQIANHDASMEEVENAFIAANAYDFIMQTELQINTIIGSGGVSLSGGEMQRLSFARALIKKSKLLILDEPTSALDKKSEEIIRRNIFARKKEQTIFLVSHRLDLLKEADLIFVLEKGKIIEKGTYHELLKNNKNIEKLYKEQFYELVGNTNE